MFNNKRLQMRKILYNSTRCGQFMQWLCQNTLTHKVHDILFLNKRLRCPNVCKFLCGHEGRTLPFWEHIDYVVEQPKRFCALKYRVRHIYTRKGISMVFNSFVKSRNGFGILIYSSAAKTNPEKNVTKTIGSNFFQEKV